MRQARPVRSVTKIGKAQSSTDLVEGVRFQADTSEYLVVVLAILVFTFVVLRTAWLSDDAYIDLRTVDNFVNGYGLTWNTTERVQSYTNPLWLLLVSCFYFFTHEPYYTTILVSTALSVLAVALLTFSIARTSISALFGITILTFSKAFTDYSTSGLENPLTHFLLAAFFLVYFRNIDSYKKLFILSFILALITTNRTDIALLVAPSLLYFLLKTGKLQGIYVCILGITPILLWEAFSLFYYGFLFPNTAYAKLNTGIGGLELAAQGLAYLINSINLDPLTLLAISLSIIIPFVEWKTDEMPVVIGIFIYLIYIVKIGGDFMSGRFLAAPLFVGVVLLARTRLDDIRGTCIALFVAVLLVGFGSPRPPLLSGKDYEVTSPPSSAIDDKGIADERGFYYRSTGLLRVHRGVEEPQPFPPPQVPQTHTGRPPAVVQYNVGFPGFYAGPNVHIVDVNALTDALLARLPAVYDPNWRIGHFTRVIPDGYLDTLNSGKNVIRDKNLATYYDKLSLITRGRLFDINRLIEIWNMNTGKYNKLIDFDTYRYPGRVNVRLDQLEPPKHEGSSLDAPANIRFPASGVQIDLQERSHMRRLEVSLDQNATYQIIYLDRGFAIAKQTLESTLHYNAGFSVRQSSPPTGLAIYSIDIPPTVAAQGYDNLWILPIRGDNQYRIGYLKLSK